MNDITLAATLYQLISPLLWHTGLKRHGFKDFEEGLRSGKSCCQTVLLAKASSSSALKYDARVVVYQQAWYVCLSERKT